MNKKFVSFIFSGLVFLALLTPFFVFRDLLFPYVSSKAFYFRILVELALPFYLTLVFENKNYRPNLKNPLTISVLAFFLFNFLAGIFGVNVLRSIWGNFERMGGVFYLAHLVLLYFYVLLLGQISPRNLRSFLQILVGIGAAISLEGIMVQITQNHFLFNDPSYPRVSGTLGNPIFIASFLILPMLLSAFFAVSETITWKKISYWVAAFLQVWIIFLSQTRGAVVGLGIGIFIAAVLYVILNPVRELKVFGAWSLFVFSGVVILLFSLHSHLPQGSLLGRVFNLKDSNTEARLIQWKVALTGYKDSPLLGVGPENYYVISNKYYNPEIFQYDPSWFDKPHNYLIEVLVTSGALGFAAYLAILVFSFWTLWEAWRKQIIILSEFCLLVCGIIAYQIQNLFVFDTVAASVAFFSYVGFMGYLWHESCRVEAKQKNIKNIFGTSSGYFVFGISALVVLYIVYVCNVTGMQLGKGINYGYAYASVNPQQAKGYFEDAKNLPFDFDPIQFASKYAAFAENLAQNPQSQTADFINQNIKDAISVEKDALLQVKNDPTGWQELARLYLSSATYNKSQLDPDAVNAAQESIKLAPKRPEGNLLLARLYIVSGNFNAAQAVIENVINTIPKDAAAKMQLAVIYVNSGQINKALEVAQTALDQGYRPTRSAEIEWMGDNYQKQNNFSAAANIYRLLTQIDPSNLQNLWLLAQMDAKIGKNDEALQIAQSLIKSDPADAAHFQEFINSLNQK